MADAPAGNFFSRLDARARVLVLFGVIIGIVLLIYLGTRYFSSGASTTGASRVANAPQGLQSVPGGQLTPEYYRALQQANAQSAQQAQMTGGSAVPTLINLGGQSGAATGGCVICSDKSANVKTLLDDMLKQGKISPDTSTMLQQLADKKVSVDEYANQLSQLVKQGKLTPQQARDLLDQYTKQHANAMLDESSKMIDSMIKSGKLPLDVANQLLDAQKRGVSPSIYSRLLQGFVRQGKILQADAQQLLAQYTQQKSKDIIAKSIAILKDMESQGKILPDILTELTGLETKMVPIAQFDSKLQDYVKANKMVPAVATDILNEYKSQKDEIGSAAATSGMAKKAEADAYQEIDDLVQTGKMPPEVGNQLKDMIGKHVPMNDFSSFVNLQVSLKKITPEIAKLKIDDYKSVMCLSDLANQLSALQGNNAPDSVYADTLKTAVNSGCISPEQAADMMRLYLASKSTGPTEIGGGSATEAFAKLQANAAASAGSTGASESQFAGQPPNQPMSEEELQNQQQIEAQRAVRVQALMDAMNGQAGKFVAAWQTPPVIGHTGGSMYSRAGVEERSELRSSRSSSEAITHVGAVPARALIKAGDIAFAVLDTAVNSDYPDTPVMATIVEGRLKGAKLLGKLATTKGVSGQQDRVALNFTLLNMDSWPASRTVTCSAVDPDTARTVLASHVDYHYMLRFGAVMATSFLTGYAKALTTSGGTTTTGIFGTSTTNPQLSPSQKIATAFGEIGTQLGAVTQNYTNIPPTVKVDSGVSLGILFMADVT